MAINQEVMEGNWRQIKGDVLQRWGQVSDNELEEARGNVEQLIGLLQERTGEAREELESYLKQVADDGASAVRRATDAVRDSAGQATEAARQAAERAANTARAGLDQTGKMVRNRPVESLAVCFGAGLITGVVVGLLIRSR
jgi:uncharacterized protein YjbJ (UPF0337 family)